MRVGVVGINHKLADLRLRELLAKCCRRRFSTESSTHGDHFFTLLSTCNRTEIYFSSEDLANTHTYLLSILREEVLEEFDQKLYSYFGLDCFLHLSRVTAGMDSAIVAETEIQGQVKNAYELSAEYSQLPEEIHFLFQKALKIGKTVRTALPMKKGLPNLEHAVFNKGLEHFDSPLQANVLFIGASRINANILSFLKARQVNSITICNRSAQGAQKFVDLYGICQIPWDALKDWHTYDWIILGTKSPDYLITREMIPQHFDHRKLLIDLSVPRNVDPHLNAHPAIHLLNIDQLNQMLRIRRKSMVNMITEAEALIFNSVKRQMELFSDKGKAREHYLLLQA